MPARKPFISGEVFGRLITLKCLSGINTPTRQRIIKCKCTCGNVHKVKYVYLQHGRTKSCGCLNAEGPSEVTKAKMKAAKPPVHPLKNHPLRVHIILANKRCYDPPNKAAEKYVERGIKVCTAWREPFPIGLQNFIKWNESLPKDKQWRYGLTLDRINNDRSYYPINCRWATPLQQARNTSVNLWTEFQGKKVLFVTMWEKYKHKDTTRTTAASRFRRGMHPYFSCITPPLLGGGKSSIHRRYESWIRGNPKMYKDWLETKTCRAYLYGEKEPRG